MKKIMLLATVIGLVLVFGLSFAEESVAKTKGPMGDPDSLINYLDPSNAVVTVPAHRGLYGLTEEGLAGAGGSAGGGRSGNPDSFINYLDPSNVNAPVAKVTGKATWGVMRDDPDSFINTLDPNQ
jgi:hypothetical protein